MAKKAEFNFKIRQLANGFIVTAQVYDDADEYGPLGNGERVEYLALTLEDAATYAAKGIEQFKIRLTEQAMNGAQQAPQGAAWRGRAVVDAVAVAGN